MRSLVVHQQIERMNWADEPATWKQLQFLKSRGHQLSRGLTKTEASELIAILGGPSHLQVPASQPAAQPLVNAYHLHQQVTNGRQALEQAVSNHAESLQQQLHFAVEARLEFWFETCRGTTRMKINSPQALELYRNHGCLYAEPTREMVQSILKALDAAMPFWDRDHPELFFQALGLNFPELRKQPSAQP